MQTKGDYSSLAGKTILVTGANGGIGSALIEELLARGARKIYAGARGAAALAALEELAPGRIVPMHLDIIRPVSVRVAAERCQDVDLVINNAGINRNRGLFGPDAMESAREEMEVNFFGSLAMCRTFAPALIARGGAIVNICSIIGLVNLPPAGTYCASKAAAHSLLQGVRAELAPKGVRVIGVYPGPVDTSMTAGQPMPKATPAQVAQAILDGIENGDEEIFPDTMSRQVRAALAADPKQVEREFAAMVSP